jgi:hypothetical protein
MRRMRDSTWIYLVPALALAIGGAYLFKYSNPANQETELGPVAVLKPSDFPRPRKDAARAPASFEAPVTEKELRDVERRVNQARVKLEAASGAADCASIEFPGAGLEHTTVDAADWDAVMKGFHDAKADLMAWLRSRRADIPEETAARMAREVADIRIQRPPVPEEGELNWRGIVLRARDAAGQPVIRMGGGFLKLARTQPERARFELARALAQSWSPCELKAAQALWQPLLQCLGVNDANACQPGSVSESAWAVSTTLAAVVSHPGCAITAFKEPAHAACLASIPLPTRAIASKEHL